MSHLVPVSPRLCAAVLAATAVMGTQAALATAADAAPARAAITVAASDASVHPGEQVVLSGRMTRGGRAVGGVVQVLAQHGDAWVALRGARVGTHDDGTYRVRVVLSATGARQLRVVGDPAVVGLRNGIATTTIAVR